MDPFLSKPPQDENENSCCPSSKPVVPHKFEKRFFGRNITNIQLNTNNDCSIKPGTSQVLDESLSNASAYDVGEEAKASKPLGFRCLTKEISTEAPVSLPSPEYTDDIDAYLFTIEQVNPPKLDQTELTEKMRAILVDWLADVHLRFKLVPETLFLTVSIIDQYLSKSTVPRQKLQLLGVTAMLIACKYEEIYSPEVKDFAYITDNSYTKLEILQMEQLVLKTLDFNITTPSSYRFLQRFVQFLGTRNRKVESMAEYLIELSLIDCKMRTYKPSMVAAAALYISNRVLNKDKCWNPKMSKKTQYTDFNLKMAVKDLMILMQLAEKSTLKATRTKFSLPKYGEVAKLTFKRKIVS